MSYATLFWTGWAVAALTAIACVLAIHAVLSNEREIDRYMRERVTDVQNPAARGEAATTGRGGLQ